MASEPLALRAVSMGISVISQTPRVAFGYLAARLVLYLLGRRRNLLLSQTTFPKRMFSLFLYTEAAWYAWCKLVVERSAQTVAVPDDRVISLTHEQRAVLFERCLRVVESPQVFASAWFLGGIQFHELKLDNIKDWLSWGLFSERVDTMTAEQTHEMNVLIDKICARISPTFKFPLGKNHNAVVMKFTHAPLESRHRPLFVYGAVHFALQTVLTPTALYLRGGFVLRRCAKNPSFAYFIKRGRSTTKLPVVLTHGIGVGPLPYLGFMEEIQGLLQDDGERTYIMPFLEAVSQQVHPYELSREGYCRGLTRLLDDLGVAKAHLFGHSYGSFTVAWMALVAPHRVASYGFLDPVCFLLHQPRTLLNILYKPADSALEDVGHYFFRSELFFNAYVRRRFAWYSNILWLEEIGETPCVLALSELDDVVPTAPLREYLRAFNNNESPCKNVAGDILREVEASPSKRYAAESPSPLRYGSSSPRTTDVGVHDAPWAKIDEVYLEDARHGQMLFDATARLAVASRLVQNIERAEKL